MTSYIIVFIIGSFTSIAMAPYSFTPALFIGLSSLYLYVKDTKSIKKAAFYTYIFHLGYFGFSLSWVGNALLVEDNPYWWAWSFAILGLPIILSCFHALAISLYKIIYKGPSEFINYILFCSSLFLAEYLRGHLFTGFPWNLYGYSWISSLPIAQLASLSSIYLLTFIAIFWAVSPIHIVKAKCKKMSAVMLCMTIVASYVYGTVKLKPISLNTEKNISFTLVQPNIPQHEKWQHSKRAENFLKLIDLSKYKKTSETNSEAYYILWPETAVAPDIMKASWAREIIKQTLSQYPAPAYLITGALRKDDDQYFNSIVTYDNNLQIIHLYNKEHLVPFGEYMPMKNILNIAPIVGFTGFEKGINNTINTTKHGISINTLICYEIIFPKYSTREDTDIIINLTNDAWYGKSSGPYQHLTQTKFRAIESGKTVLRVANTGITAVIKPNGQILQHIDLNINKAIIQEIPIAIAK